MIQHDMATLDTFIEMNGSTTRQNIARWMSLGVREGAFCVYMYIVLVYVDSLLHNLGIRIIIIPRTNDLVLLHINSVALQTLLIC